MNIGVVSPSSNLRNCRVRYERALQFLRSHGHCVFEGELARRDYYYTTGTVEERAHELNQMIHNDAIELIFFSIGGYNSASIIPYIDYEYLRKNRKIFVGNSDITSILVALSHIDNVELFYFPTLVPAFGEIGDMLIENYKYFEEVIMTRNTSYRYKVPKKWTDDWVNWGNFEREKRTNDNEWKVVKSGIAEGILVGGNLNTLVKLLASDYFYNLDGKILFLEDTSISAGALEGTVTSLVMSNRMRGVKGLVVCKCEKYNDEGMPLNYGEFICSLFKDFDIPMLIDFDCGHTHPAIPLQIGKLYRLNLAPNSIEFERRN